MLAVRTNENSYLKSIYIAICRLFAYWDVPEKEERETRSLLASAGTTSTVLFIWQSVTSQPLLPEEILCTDDEEEGADRVLGNQMRRELCDINDHHRALKLL